MRNENNQIHYNYDCWGTGVPCGKEYINQIKLNEMIQQVTVYAVVCDRCGKDHTEKTDFCGWNDRTYAENIAIESGWEKREDDEHICEDCQVEELNYICRDDLID